MTTYVCIVEKDNKKTLVKKSANNAEEVKTNLIKSGYKVKNIRKEDIFNKEINQKRKTQNLKKLKERKQWFNKLIYDFFK